jgi:metal-sulfur cluster biosynthetic enzyme
MATLSGSSDQFVANAVALKMHFEYRNAVEVQMSSQADELTELQVMAALRDVEDPELGISVVDLGLVYSVEAHERTIRVAMTMTTPACPLHASISQAAEEAIRSHLPEVAAVTIEIVWDPPWNPKMMSQAARRQLGWKD